MSRPDDLSGLLTGAGSDTAVGFRKGQIVSWDPFTARNVIRIDGQPFRDLSILNTSEATLLRPGDWVGILTVANGSWFILGRITVPGTPEAASALSSIRAAADTLMWTEATTSTTFTDLNTIGPAVDVVVGATGRLLVMVTTGFDFNGNNSTSAGYMSYHLEGPVTRGASDFKSVVARHTTTASFVVGDRFTATNLETGLPPGSYRVTAKYKIIGASAQFFDRSLVAIPL